MILRTPHYYKEFRCIASECKDNCCMGGWEIDIDEETAREYLELQGEFGDRLRTSIDSSEGEYCFKLKNGQCPFLDNDNLCQIYQELGENKMGVVCTQFPRYTEYYGNVKETGIGLACEEAERIIFTDREAFTYDESETAEKVMEDSEYDSELGNILWSVRDYFLDILQGSGTICNKLAILLHLADKIQKEINDNSYSNILNILDNKYFNVDNYPPKSTRLGIDSIICAYEQLEVLNDNWTRALDELKNTLFDNKMTDEEYVGVHKEFNKYISQREYEYSNLLKYYLFRYLMKAAYDHNLLEKIQLMSANYLMIRELDVTRYIVNNRKFSFEDRIDTVHVFSREVEYSEDNLEELAEEFIFDEIFESDNLIKVISGLQ